MTDITQQLCIRAKNSMEKFADGEPIVNYGEWKSWEIACVREGRDIPPAEFKARPEEEKRKYSRVAWMLR